MSARDESKLARVAFCISRLSNARGTDRWRADAHARIWTRLTAHARILVRKSAAMQKRCFRTMSKDRAALFFLWWRALRRSTILKKVSSGEFTIRALLLYININININMGRFNGITYYIYIYKVGANVVPIPPVVAAAYRPIQCRSTAKEKEL